jgi:hypothetical protein
VRPDTHILGPIFKRFLRSEERLSRLENARGKYRTIYCKSCIPQGNRPVLASPLLLMSDFVHKLIGFHTSGLTVPKILIADDSEFLRTHLRSFLQRPDWVVCGEAANGRQAVLMASQLKPDLIVLDFAMPCSMEFKRQRRF